MLSIGITGGIGSGKSTVCSILENLGYPVFYADKVGREISDQNFKVINQIKNLLGDEAYKNGILNRTWVAQRIFANTSLKDALNAIIHPAVFEAFENWKKQQNATIVFNESALLFETNSYMRFDKTILLVAEQELRIQRVMSRDALKRDEILSRMQQQLSDPEKILKADFVVQNNTTDLLLPQVLEIIKRLKSVI